MLKKVFFKQKNKSSILANNRGSAMITALVVGIVIFAFCLSMLLVAYTLFAQASRNEVQLGCKTLAWSTIEEIEEELSDTNSELNLYLKSKLQEFDSAGDENINREVCFTLNGTEAASTYDVKVTFIIDGKSKIETSVACYKDFGNFRDVQSYTVNKTLSLK